MRTSFNRAKPPPQPTKTEVKATAGPPAEFAEVVVWTLVSVAAWASFLLLPGRISGPLRRGAALGMNDMPNAAHYMHLCMWLWPCMDYIYRATSLLVGNLRDAVTFLPGLADPQGAACQESSVCAAVVQIREIVAKGASAMHETSVIGAMNTLLNDGPASGFAGLHHRQVLGIASAVTLMLIFVGLYVFHIRPARKIRADPKRDFTPPLFPFYGGMMLWSFTFATAFAFVKGTPILMRQVYPAAVMILVVFSMVAP